MIDKKTILAVASAFACLTATDPLAYAGSESVSGKEMKQVAMQPAEEINWTGFYVGGFGGYKFALIDTDLTLTGDWLGPSNTDPFDKNFIEPFSPRDLDTSGAEAGSFIGYNYQWNRWVMGLEASGGYLWVRDYFNTGIFTVPSTGDVYNVATSFKTHYLATFGPRIGYTFGKWLPYITGGLAVGDLDFYQSVVQHNLFFHEKNSTNETQAGWMVGGGVQYALNKHWSLRAQYQYADLGCVDFDSIGTSPFQGYTGHHEACLREHNASFGVIYQF